MEINVEKEKVFKITPSSVDYALQCKRLPTTICGFYSTALYTLKKIIDKRINIININFDLNNHRWDDSPDVDKHIHFNKILNENGVINFY